MSAAARFNLFRGVLFFAGASLLFYVPYKYLTQPEAMVGLYGILFPLSAILAVFGITLSLVPSVSRRLPGLVSIPVGLLAAGWLTTGLECIPTLTRAILTHPAGGLFATFHMALQHVVLSVGVAMLALRPEQTEAYFGLGENEPDAATEPVATEGM